MYCRARVLDVCNPASDDTPRAITIWERKSSKKHAAKIIRDHIFLVLPTVPSENACTSNLYIKKNEKHMFFLETTEIIKTTIFISVSRLLYLTDPIHSTKRYNSLMVFVISLASFMCPSRGLLEWPGLDSDTFIIQESSGNHLGIIRESSRIRQGCLGWPGWLGGAEVFVSSTKTNIKSTR